MKLYPVKFYSRKTFLVSSGWVLNFYQSNITAFSKVDGDKLKSVLLVQLSQE